MPPIIQAANRTYPDIYMNRNVFCVMCTNQFPIMADEENGRWSKSRVFAC